MITEQETPKTMSQLLNAEQAAQKRRNAALKSLLTTTECLAQRVQFELEHPSDSAEYMVTEAIDSVELAAKQLVATVNDLPERELPIHWKEIAL